MKEHYHTLEYGMISKHFVVFCRFVLYIYYKCKRYYQYINLSIQMIRSAASLSLDKCV